MSFPKELTDMKNWVVAKKGNKIPLNARTLKAASSTNPETWSTYEDAIKAENCSLGFVFSNNGIIGIDIDDGFDEMGLPTQLALDIISKCNSYTETSRSGRGFHILVKGTLTFKGKNNRAGVEIYREARYFIMTGNIVSDYSEIIENQEAIDYVTQTYFKEEEKAYESNTQRVSGVKVGSNIYETKLEFVGGKLRTTYPPVGQGGRNISMLSYAGQLIKQGMSDYDVYQEVLKCNQEACTPPLSVGEIESIVNSALRYK